MFIYEYNIKRQLLGVYHVYQCLFTSTTSVVPSDEAYMYHKRLTTREAFELAKYISKSPGGKWRPTDYLPVPYFDTASIGLHFNYFTKYSFMIGIMFDYKVDDG